MTGKNGSFSSHIHLSYVWIEESPNTAADRGVAPLERETTSNRGVAPPER